MNNIYYYQKPKSTDKYLPNLWICCGAAHDNKKQNDFYTAIYAEYDSRETRGGTYKGYLCCPDGYDVVIVEDFHGNTSDLENATIVRQY